MVTRRIWIVDGHNMIFALRRLQGLQIAGHGDEARRELEERLRRFAQTKRQDVLVVFDGNDLLWNPDVLREPFFEVVYAAPREGGADARIIHAARSGQQQGRRVTVVTDDINTLARKLPERVDHLGVQAFRLKYMDHPAGRTSKRVEGDFSGVERELEALAAGRRRDGSPGGRRRARRDPRRRTCRLLRAPHRPFHRSRPAWLRTAHRQLRDRGRARPRAWRGLLDRAGGLPPGALRHAQRDQRVHRHGRSRGESPEAAGRAVPGLTGATAHSTANTSAAHTPAPTATWAAWSGWGSANSTIAAATTTCSVTSASTPHAPRARVRTAHPSE